MPYKLKAIIFDVDGTLANTEKYAHFPACNDAIAEIGLPFQWDWDGYIKLFHTVGGNANRLRLYLKQLGYSPEETEDYVSKFTPAKQRFYIERYLPQVALRKGIKDIMQQAVDKGLKLAMVSTSHESQITALLNAQFTEFLPHISFVFGKESGRKTENDGFLHKKCLAALELPPEQVLMIEDAQDGLEAAVCAGIPTAVFYNEYTYGSDFTGARLVAPSIQHFNLNDLEKIIFTHP